MFIFCVAKNPAQSNDQNFPTPITANQISGTIKARDLGDSRSTTYFYTFNGAQGDIFINIQTQNLNGDIDIFTADGLKPLTKIAVYADASDNETGRVVYLRKSEKLLLRIEGKTPNDDSATFAIKFAGSFIAASESATEQTSAPVVSGVTDSDVKVNSVGTIISVKAKPTQIPQPAKIDVKNSETVADNALPKVEDKPAGEKPQKPVKKPRPVKINKPSKTPDETENKEVAVEENPIPAVVKKPKKIKEKPSQKPSEVERESAADENAVNFDNDKTNEIAPAVNKSDAKKAAEKARLEALTNIHLIILFKDGTKIERPMSEILKVGVDKTILTVITKDGTIGRYSLLDVAKFTIE